MIAWGVGPQRRRGRPVSVSSDGMALEPGDIDEGRSSSSSTPRSFVRPHSDGSTRAPRGGDGSLTERFCNLFFRI